MTELSSRPDVASLEIPMDQWTQPFWDATAQRTLLLPRCGACGTFRWPPGPFCPTCQSQEISWSPSGPGYLYSYTLLSVPAEGEPPRIVVPGLVEFPEAQGVRLLAPIVDSPVEALAIGIPLELTWLDGANAVLPGFKTA